MALEGTVTDSNGNTVGGATVIAVDQNDLSIIGTAVTNSDGSYYIETPNETTAHVTVHYDDGTKYNAESKPFISVSPEAVYTTIDSFEDDGIGEYTGYTSQFNVSSEAFAVNGNNVLVGTDAAGGYHDIVSMSGLNYYPSRGDEFSYSFRVTSTDNSKTRCGMIWAAGSSSMDEMYVTYTRLEDANTVFQLREYTGGGLGEFDSTQFSPDPDKWYDCYIDFDTAGDGTISFEVTEYGDSTVLASGSINSTLHDSGGVGWFKENNGAVTYMDHARLHGEAGPDITLVESYEDQSWAAYDVETDGTTADYAFNTSNAYDGNVAAERTSTGYPKIGSTSGLNAYPGQGDEFVVWMYNSISSANASTCHFGCYFAGNDMNNVYFIRNRVDMGTVQIDKYHSDGDDSFANFNADLPAGWNKFIVRWDDGSTFGGAEGDFTLIAEDSDGNELGRGTGNDTAFQGSAGSTPFYGMWGGVESGERIMWDYAHITNR